MTIGAGGEKLEGVTGRLERTARAVGRWWRSWWVLTDQPASLRDTWRSTDLGTTRLPIGPHTPPVVIRPPRGDDPGEVDDSAEQDRKARRAKLKRIWRFSNAVDRRIFLILILVAPLVVQGPLRWLLQRPTRRLPFYLFLLVFAAWLVAVT